MLNDPRDLFASPERMAECPEIYAPRQTLDLTAAMANTSAQAETAAKKDRMIERAGANMDKVKTKQAERYRPTFSPRKEPVDKPATKCYIRGTDTNNSKEKPMSTFGEEEVAAERALDNELEIHLAKNDDLAGETEIAPAMRPVNDASLDATFIKAGNATFTVTSLGTGTRFTYKVQIAKDRQTGKRSENGPWFVSVLTGSDNTSDFQFMGTIFAAGEWNGNPTPEKFVFSQKSRITQDAPSAKAFSWLHRNLANPKLDQLVSIHHEGSCGRCGRKLTVPTSIESGYGPDCINKIEG